jgi:threonylcarbamoyladenosine tRNA methylthiotransferase MtaB
MPSVFVQTLGCKLNQLESEAFADAFTQAGFDLYKNEDSFSPSIIIVNTCTVTSKADQKARRVIRKALRDYPDSCVIVTGCYAQLNQAQIEKLETGRGEDSRHERLFVLKGMGKESILNLPPYLCKCGNGLPLAVKMWHKNETVKSGGHSPPPENDGVFQFNPKRFSDHTRVFLKIQDGCDRHCTYCRVCLARGPSVSLDAEQALSRLRVLEETHAEAVITGVNISRYSDAKAGSLGELLDFLLRGTEKIHLRLSSLEPDSIDESLVKILSHKRIRPHFHLSVQSCSDKILEKMGRGCNSEIIKNAASMLRRAKDDPFLACDIIAGFPGETKEEFEKTRELCKEINFAWIHVFPYSKRPGTPACSFPETVSEREKTQRVQTLTSLARGGRADYVRRWLGREVEVLVEKGDFSKSGCKGISENYLKIFVRHNGEAPPPGSVLRCRISSEYKGENFDAAADILPGVLPAERVPEHEIPLIVT